MNKDFDLKPYLIHEDEVPDRDACLCAVVCVFFQGSLIKTGYCSDITKTWDFDSVVSETIGDAFGEYSVSEITHIEHQQCTFGTFIEDCLFDPDVRFDKEQIQMGGKREETPPWNGQKIRIRYRDDKRWFSLSDEWQVEVFIKENDHLYNEKKQRHEEHLKNIEELFVIDVSNAFGVSRDVVQEAMEDYGFNPRNVNTLSKIVEGVSFLSRYLNKQGSK